MLANIDWLALVKFWNNGADGNSQQQRLYFEEFRHGVTGGLHSGINFDNRAPSHYDSEVDKVVQAQVK